MGNDMWRSDMWRNDMWGNDMWGSIGGSGHRADSRKGRYDPLQG